MKRSSLTPRPRVAALVRATAIGALTFASAACGDDDGGTTTVADSDVAPTAGPCAHNSGGPECETTGLTAMTETASGSSTGGNDADTDIAPTAGPCAHDPGSPGCASSSSSEGSGADSSGTGGSGSSSSGG